MIAKTGKEIVGLGFWGAASWLFPRRCRKGGGLPSEGEHIPVLFEPVFLLVSSERCLLLANTLVPRQQEVKPVLGPWLVVRLEQKREFPGSIATLVE